MIGEWGWKDAWFSEAGLPTATQDECDSTEAKKGCGGRLGDSGTITQREVVDRAVRSGAPRLPADGGYAGSVITRLASYKGVGSIGWELGIPGDGRVSFTGERVEFDSHVQWVGAIQGGACGILEVSGSALDAVCAAAAGISNLMINLLDIYTTISESEGRPITPLSEGNGCIEGVDEAIIWRERQGHEVVVSINEEPVRLEYRRGSPCRTAGGDIRRGAVQTGSAAAVEVVEVDHACVGRGEGEAGECGEGHRCFQLFVHLHNVVTWVGSIFIC